MRIIFHSLALLLLLLLPTNQQIQNPINTNVNYEGDFDSMHTIHQSPQPSQPAQQQQEQTEEYEEQEYHYEQEEEDMLQFSEYMAEFFPDQTFTFKLDSNQLEEFMLWPGAEVQLIRGMYHAETTSDEDESDSTVSLALYDNDHLIRKYRQQRLGIFNIPHNLKDHKYSFKFQNGESPSEIYFSYQLVSKLRNESEGLKNESEIQRVTKQFQKVNLLIVQQEAEMSRIVGIGERHQQKIDGYLQSVQWSLLFEALMITLGNIASLLLLKKQIYAGYQLLV